MRDGFDADLYAARGLGGIEIAEFEEEGLEAERRAVVVVLARCSVPY